MMHTPLQCEFYTARLSDGLYKHTCKLCQCVRISKYNKYYKACDIQVSQDLRLTLLVGSYISAIIIKYAGETAIESCGCGSVIAEMNAIGPQGVRDNIEKYVDHLAKQADEKGWFRDPTENDGKRRLRWWKAFNLAAKASGTRRLFIRQLILHACRKAEREEKNRSPVDVVYTLGSGSRWDDNELRYSLRSLEKYASRLGRVFVVGHKPEWLAGVVHVPADDVHHCNKDANLIDKILLAIKAGCSKRFIFASDDQLLLAPVDLSTVPAMYGEDLTGKDEWKDGRWWKRLQSTRDYLVSRNLPVLNYDTHVFQPFDAKEFVRVASEAPYADGLGFCINTLIHNASKPTNAVPINGRKLNIDNDTWNLERIRKSSGGKMFLGYNDNGLTDTLKRFLAERFPDISKYETDDIPQAIAAIQQPNQPQQRGIVTLAGGPVYSMNAYINCRMLRKLGCTLPIEWCYLGAELSPMWIDLIERTISDIRLVNLGGTKLDNTKKNGGWQAKVEAVLQSNFAELLFLDADSFPLRDPAPLFDHPLFHAHDCILWPDIHEWTPQQQEIIKQHYGVDASGRQVESGQMLFRKERCMEGLLKTREINRNSRAAYRILFGDKDTFLIGALQAGTNYIVNPHPVKKCCRQKNLMQHDLDGNRMFAHLTKDKWGPNTIANLNREYYPLLDDAIEIFNEIKYDYATLWPIGSTEENMKVRDTICANEAARIINGDMYQIRPMIGHRVPVKYIVDLGGNAGAFTVAASAAYPDSEIIVVEPDPELMADIRYNTKDCKAKIYYVEKACVGDERETVRFVRVARNRGGGNIVHDPAAIEMMPEDELLTVPATTLPKLLAEYGFQSIDILKMDVEGVEGEVLVSLKNAGWLPRVHWIRGEWHGQENKPIIMESLRDTHVCKLQEHPANGELIAHNKDDV